MASLIEKLKQILNASGRPPQTDVVVLDSEKLAQLMHLLSHTREDELSCEEVANRLDEYVDCLAGHMAGSEVVPLMDHHLSMCPDCHEALDALLRAIETAGGEQEAGL